MVRFQGAIGWEKEGLGVGFGGAELDKPGVMRVRPAGLDRDSELVLAGPMVMLDFRSPRSTGASDACSATRSLALR